MNNLNLDINRGFPPILNQKLYPIFPCDNQDLESIIENHDMAFEENFVLNKEIDTHRPKTVNENNPLKFDNLSDYNFDNHLISTNENNTSQFYKDLFPSVIGEKSNSQCKDKKIFKIVKINKKIGRIKKNSFLKGIHNNLSQDNIIRKIKGRFQEKLRLYINNEYKKYILNKTFQKKKINNWLKKINPKISHKMKKEENLKWFETKIFEIFSENVSSKYSAYSSDLNKKKIDRLISLNEAKNVIDILFNNIETFYIKYINDEKIEGFKTLKEDLKDLKSFMITRNQENIDDYLRKYELFNNIKNS